MIIEAVLVLAGGYLFGVLFSLSGLWRETRRVFDNTLMTLTTLRSRGRSDSDKEAVARHAAILLAAYALKAIGGLVAFAAISVLPMIPAVMVGWTSWSALLEASVHPAVLLAGIAVFVLGARVSRAQESRYSMADRALHRLAFIRPVQLAFEEAEEGRLGAAISSVTLRSPVFICGLPRAGSTILLQQIENISGFVSPIYRDMPFVTAPALWASLTNNRRTPGKVGERAHGDGVMTGVNSPECFDEVLWMRHFAQQYGPDSVQPFSGVRTTPEFAKEWRRWMGSVLLALRAADDGTLVLKNNAHIGRLQLIEGYWPDAVILVPFRNPMDQATSLDTQHSRTIVRQQADKFGRRYMDDLGHFEFGTGHRPIAFPDFKHQDMRPNGIAYWLAYWDAAYRHILATLPANAVLWDYDRACRNPEQAARVLEKALGSAIAGPLQPVWRAGASHGELAGIHTNHAAKNTYLELRQHPQNPFR